METYEKLRLYLDELGPIGLPETEDGLCKDWLKTVYSPEEAEAVTHLRLKAEPISVISDRMGKTTEEATAILETMVNKATAIKETDEQGRLSYGAMPVCQGWLDIYFIKRADDAEYIEKQWNYMLKGGWAQQALEAKTTSMRIIPVETAVSQDSVIHPYERMSEYLQHVARPIAVMPCACRTRMASEGHTCTAGPMEACISFGHHAEYVINDGLGREIDAEEALEIVRQTDEAGCIHRAGNFTDWRDASYICNCCQCCCSGISPFEEYFKQSTKKGVMPSNFLVVIDETVCNGCELCLERCSFFALEMIDGVPSVKKEHCVGCGLCATGCPEEAIKLISKPEDDRVEPPKDIEVLSRIAFKERSID